MVTETDLQSVVNDSLVDFNIPPTEIEKRKYFGSSLINEFKKQFETKCWFVPHFAIISFHVLMGQLPNIKNIKIKIGNNFEDCRVHMLLLQESGSGKGGGFSFVNDIAERLGLNFHSVGDLTNSALAGSMSVDEKGNTDLKHGILDPRYNDGEGVNIVASSEASQLIDTRNNYFDKNAILNLQKAMNRMNTADNVISKETGISNEKISFNTDVSLYLTTFKPTRLFQTMTQTGFLQRLVLLYNPITLEDKWKVGKKHLELLGADDKNHSDIKNVVGALRYINNFYSGIDRLKFTEKARKGFLKGVLPYIYKPLIQLETNTRHEVKKFTTRYQVLLYKLAWHHAMTRLSEKIEISDVAYAKKVFLPIFRKLIGFMENEYVVDSRQKLKTDSQSKDIINVYKQFEEKSDKKKPWIKKIYLTKALMKKWKISDEAARHRLETHIALFHIRRTNAGGKMLKLRDNIKSF